MHYHIDRDMSPKKRYDQPCPSLHAMQLVNSRERIARLTSLSDFLKETEKNCLFLGPVCLKKIVS